MTSKRVLFWKVTDVGTVNASVSCSVIRVLNGFPTLSSLWEEIKKKKVREMFLFILFLFV